jgi:hypothetical protein
MPENTRSIPQESQASASIMIDGHSIRLNFTREPSDHVMENVREQLIRSLVGASDNDKIDR